jgi:hypothetical protein
MASQQKRAAEFRRLHKGPKILVLANCWDAGSARLIESLGARAMATTSAGVAWALGYPDGDALPLDLLVAASVSPALSPAHRRYGKRLGHFTKTVGAAVANHRASAIGMISRMAPSPACSAAR